MLHGGSGDQFAGKFAANDDFVGLGPLAVANVGSIDQFDDGVDVRIQTLNRQGGKNHLCISCPGLQAIVTQNDG